MTEKFLPKLMSAFAALGLAASPVALAAQNVGVGGNLAIPENITIFGQSDPNIRTATAVVNGSVITGTDVDHRVALVLASSQAEVPEEEVARLRAQVLRNLIDETLQMQAASLQEIEISSAEVDQSYQQLAQQNFGQNPEAMDSYLISIGSSPATLKRQIRGEMAWQRLINRQIAPFVNVSQEEVTEILERMEQSRGTEEYRLGEIYLSATPDTQSAVMQNAQRIIEQLQQGGSFVAYARQFSENTAANVGGDLGWLRLAMLPQELSSAASQMQPGQLVGPIQVPGGISILYLIDKRQVLMADPRDAVLSLKQISIAFPEGVSEAQARATVQRFGEMVTSIRGCGDAERAAAAIGAEVVTNDQIGARQLPEALQNTVLQMQVGQTTPPFGSIEDGVRVLMLCGRDDPQVAGAPNAEQLRRRIEDERIEKRARRYLRDLRNDAFIEYS